ncbi:Anti-sigma regulatory factor (Ser/Thr protein kinase) [Desulfocicer vacuolatum DSM 3385]|uniref:Anti-sigma regulatory factor (Ser/Thr protein kinase) n=1 Tax=Desulfocicer vacuolatum DSM 3385 TaxID=1121400 RepID=A0A1W2E921_9BACT|nr:ATP-binding protein [Desulfocicer vacuolatum]SMD06241.1 Anti-sigma regulatory factor (Ser/Thr protein kinase) [Desulfocicer vacuolatum DSM 3385]
MIGNTWPATLNSLTSIQEFVQNHITPASLQTGKLPVIHVIVEEIITNIINHAYKDTDSGNISIEFQQLNDKVIISFADTGPPFDPLTADPPDITKEIDERDIGGLGLFMVTQMADDIEYKRSNHKNIITVTINMAKEN